MNMRYLLNHCSLRNSKNIILPTIGVIGTALVLITSGCASTKPPTREIESAAMEATTEPIVLREGDVVRLTFPGAPNYSTVAAIRRDGVINLDLVGEVHAAGMTPADLQKELIRAIQNEARIASEGRPGRIIAKMNALLDESVIRALYDASAAGVNGNGSFRFVEGSIEDPEVCAAACSGAQIVLHDCGFDTRVPFLRKP